MMMMMRHHSLIEVSMYWRYFWAILLIVLGVLFLLANLGILPGSAWNYFWPLVLIAVGVLFLLGATGRGRRWASAPAVNDSLPLDGAASAQLNLKHGAGRLYVNAGSDPNLLFAGSFGGGVDKQVRRSGSELDVSLRTDVQDWTMWGPWGWWGGQGMFDWNVGLNPNIPLALTFETGASQTTLDLSALRVTNLSVKTGASATEIVMPANAGLTRARVESGAASVKVRIPNGVAARIWGKMSLGALDVDTRRFPSRAGAYESDDFATAANRVELEVEGGVGSVDVR
jgi:LiaI-LiaF-like transmembrane region